MYFIKWIENRYYFYHKQAWDILAVPQRELQLFSIRWLKSKIHTCNICFYDSLISLSDGMLRVWIYVRNITDHLSKLFSRHRHKYDVLVAFMASTMTMTKLGRQSGIVLVTLAILLHTPATYSLFTFAIFSDHSNSISSLALLIWPVVTTLLWLNEVLFWLNSHKSHCKRICSISRTFTQSSVHRRRCR